MFSFQLSVRLAASWLLIGVIGGVLPATAAQQPGTLASMHEVTRFAALPRVAQSQENPVVTGAAPAPARHRLSPWVWVAIVAGVGVGVGAGVLAGNSQSNKTSATTPGATITVGSGGVTAGAPH